MFERSDYLKLLVISLFLMAVGGYRFGTDDHVTQFPSILHLQDPEIFRTDLVNQVLYPPYIKVGLHAVLFKLAGILHVPVEYIYVVSYLVVIYLFLAASRLILLELGVRRHFVDVALMLLVPLALFYPSISHFHIVVKRLVPYLFVIPFCLFSIYFFIKEKILAASVLASTAFLVHQQIGLIIFFGMTFSLVVCGIFCRDIRSYGPTDYLRWLGPFGLVFSSYFMFLQFFGTHHGYPWFDHSWGVKLLEMTRFRVPNHLLFIAYSKIKYTAGFLICLFFVCYLGFYHFRHDKLILRLSLIAAGLSLLVLVGIFFTEVYPLPVAFNMYMFRGDVFIRLIAFYLLIVFLDRRFQFNPSKRTLGIIYLLLAVLSPFAVLLPGHFQVSIPENEIVQVSRCIESTTPKDAFILAPPDLKGVRYYTRRSVFASWKSHGLFQLPDIAEEWYRRMQLLCGFDQNFSCLGKKCRKLCARNFDNLPPEYLIQLAERYGIDYLMVRQKKTFPLPQICSTEHFAVYRIK